MHKLAPSLKPGPQLAEDCVANIPEAIEIRDAWRFRFYLKTITPEALEAINPHLTFGE